VIEHYRKHGLTSIGGAVKSIAVMMESLAQFSEDEREAAAAERARDLIIDTALTACGRGDDSVSLADLERLADTAHALFRENFMPVLAIASMMPSQSVAIYEFVGVIVYDALELAVGSGKQAVFVHFYNMSESVNDDSAQEIAGSLREQQEQIRDFLDGRVSADHRVQVTDALVKLFGKLDDRMRDLEGWHVLLASFRHDTDAQMSEVVELMAPQGHFEHTEMSAFALLCDVNPHLTSCALAEHVSKGFLTDPRIIAGPQYDNADELEGFITFLQLVTSGDLQGECQESLPGPRVASCCGDDPDWSYEEKFDEGRHGLLVSCDVDVPAIVAGFDPDDYATAVEAAFTLAALLVDASNQQANREGG
jgi:hypothetical protein